MVLNFGCVDLVYLGWRGSVNVTVESGDWIAVLAGICLAGLQLQGPATPLTSLSSAMRSSRDVAGEMAPARCCYRTTSGTRARRATATALSSKTLCASRAVRGRNRSDSVAGVTSASAIAAILLAAVDGA